MSVKVQVAFLIRRSLSLRMATLEGENMEVHRITNQGLWGGVTTLLLIWSAGFSLPVTALMMQNSGISPLQASTSWEILSHSFIQKEATFRDVAFLNATHGWVVGQKEVGLGGGIILYTNDSGDSWQLQFHNYSQHFDAIHIMCYNNGCCFLAFSYIQYHFADFH